MTRFSNPRAQHGFTLLEVLVALVVLGFLLAGLSQAVRFGLRAWDRQQTDIASRADADAVDRVLRRLIERAEPGRATVAAPVDGSSTALRFVSDIGGAGGRARAAEITLAVDGSHRLVLRWTPYLHAPRLAPPPPPQQDVLLVGVDQIEIAYWGPDQAGAPTGTPTGTRAWRSAWRGADLPELVRIRVVFPAADPRRWPPIIVAPMRAKPG